MGGMSIMIYNFRFDRSQTEEIIWRLKERKLLAQGWGGGSKELPIDSENFIVKCKKRYELATTRIPSNLTRIRDFMDGDILVTPHLPEHDKVSLHIVDGDYPVCYEYIKNDECHLNHSIKIKKSYGLAGNINIYYVDLANWYGKLQWIRLPIIPIPQFSNGFDRIIESLQKDNNIEFAKSELDDYFIAIQSKVKKLVIDNLMGINPSRGVISFEAICRKIISDGGYEFKGRNIYDGKGGDIDLWFKRQKSDLSPFETGESDLFVQVKKHEGVTDEKAVQQLLQIMSSGDFADNPDACVISLCDDFSEQAVKLAEKNGVLLINSDIFSRLFVENILKLWA